MRALVTGGSGFVGERLVQSLVAAGHDVRIFDVNASKKYPSLSVQGDLRDYDACRRAVEGIDVIFHLAALYRDDIRPRSLYYEVNVEGTKNIARCAAEQGIRHLVFTSSFSVYGLDDAGKSEDGPLAPVNDYGRSKLMAEQVLADWQAGAPQRILQVVRPSVIFGEGGRGNVWTLVQQLASGRFLMIGRGTNKKSMAYVGNIVEFLLLLMSRPSAGVTIFNYADKPDMSVDEIVRLAAQTLGRKVRRAPLPAAAAMMMGYAGDMVGLVLGRVPVLNSERIRKFLADTSLPTRRVDAIGFVRPFALKAAFVQTVRHEFPAASAAKSA